MMDYLVVDCKTEGKQASRVREFVVDPKCWSWRALLGTEKRAKRRLSSKSQSLF